MSSNSSTARLWDIKGKELAIFQGHRATIFTAEFSPDGKSVLVTSENNCILYPLTGEMLLEIIKNKNIYRLSAEEKKELGIDE